MKKHVVIFEARGGTDKGPYGYRKDSRAIIESLTKRGWTAEIVFYRDEDRGEIYKHAVEVAGAYISRVNPGNLENEIGYFQMLRELVRREVHGLPHPDAMVSFGAKNAIEKLANTALVPVDATCYYDFESFKESFPKTLSGSTRVLKQNRGSTGEGIWRVEIPEGVTLANGSVPLDTPVRCTEAKDNHVEDHELGEFIDYCVRYLDGTSGMILDMPFLPRITEGEIRVLMLRRTPVYVVHKKPVETEDAFSATLFSGAKYTYESPDKWPGVINVIQNNIDLIVDRLGGYDIPLLWTTDFILDTDPDSGKDRYVLGEINASCVGFSTHLELSEDIADEVVRLMEAESVVNRKWPAYNVT
jgi:hypothetical protein